MKITTTIIALLCFIVSPAQEVKTTKGLLLLSTSRDESSFDIFYPCVIDSTKSLKQIISTTKGSTPYLVTLDEELAEDLLLPFADRFENEALDARFADELKYCMVIPVEVVFADAKATKFAAKGKDTLLDWPVKFFKRTLFEFYNPKQLTLKGVRVISVEKLPAD